MRGREGGGEEREGVPGATSIKLLTWPYTGKLWEVSGRSPAPPSTCSHAPPPTPRLWT